MMPLTKSVGENFLLSDSDIFLRGLSESEKKNDFLVIPKGCAHGYLTLKQNSTIVYFTTNFYNKESSRGINIKDLLLINLKLPIKIKIVSNQDNLWQKKF